MGCLQHQSQDQKKDATLFSLLPSSQTGITFSNDLTYSEEFNPYFFAAIKSIADYISTKEILFSKISRSMQGSPVRVYGLRVWLLWI